MKKILLTFLIFIGSLTLFPQAPESFSYNAIVRNNSGKPIVSQTVSFRFSILSGSFGDLAYGERHIVTTDQFGFVSLVIGDGIEITGDFKNISWISDNYFLKVELDTSGGTLYTDMGITKLQSVPYALFAKTAGNGFSRDYNDLYNKPVTNGSETKISVGNNLIISGSGKSDDPYILNTKPHYVGESYGGGIVFYVYDNGEHGLISSTTDQDPGIEWYNTTRRYTNTTGDGVAAGLMNTILIIALQTNDNPMGIFAAKICADYAITFNGVTYGDWYLPSKHELYLLFLKKDLIGGFNSDCYWSSTEFSSISAWGQSFINSSQYNLNKSLKFGVRAIRAF
jgi:hypothetical protein